MADPVGSPEWWLSRLLAKIEDRRLRMELFDSYYRGEHPLPYVPRQLRDPFRRMLRQSRSNFMGLVVDAVEERLSITGFRLSADSDASADREAWRIWQANQLDADSQIGFVEALVKGVCYASVWFGEDYPRISVEDPLQTIVEHVPGAGRQRAAALKVWVDDWTGEQLANVYLPDGIYKFRRRASDFALAPPWERRRVPNEDWPLANPIGVVPIVPIVNRPRLTADGRSELDDVVDTQDRINKTLFDRSMAGEFASFRQRWATGLDIPVDDRETIEDGSPNPNFGKPVEPFKSAVDRLWVSENPEAKFGEFGQTDLKPYIDAVEQDVLHIAVVTRTPRHYLIQQGQSPSGDAIKSAETGLVAKVRRKQKPFGEAWEEVLRLARMFAGDPAPPMDSEVVWADPEYRSEGELTDAVIKQVQAGLLPVEAAQERLGYTPTQIRRFNAMRSADALMNAGLDLSGVLEVTTE